MASKARVAPEKSASGSGAEDTTASGSSSAPVPSPTSAFSEYMPVITAALDQLTTSANQLPANRSDINFHRTMDRKFANDLDEASQRVLTMTERLLTMVELGQAEAKGKGKEGAVKPSAKAGKTRRKLEEEEDVVDGYKRGVLSVVDGLLEDADSCLDDLSGQRKKAAIAIPADKLANAGTKLPGPFTQGKALGRLPSSVLHDSSLAKPQLSFPDTVDNSVDLKAWSPTLPEKSHAMVPLGFDAPLEYELSAEDKSDPSKADARRRREEKLGQHPYYYETRHLPYPTSMFTITEPREPASFDDTPFSFVDTPEALEEMVTKLQQAKEIAVDLEHHSLRTYYGITCLMQISTRDEDWIVDTLALRGELRSGKLGGVMTDPSIVKVLHGSESDILWLQRDFDIYIVNLFDTFHATKVLGFTQHSLAYLLSHYCQFEADKRYQMADWRVRPLPQELAMYARSDTHFLLYIYDRLRNALLEQSSRPPSPVDGEVDLGMTQRRNPQQAMREVLERSGDTALRLYERETYDTENGRGSGGWANLARKQLHQGSIHEEVGAVFKAVHAWRDQFARAADESPFYIMPSDLVKTLATRFLSTVAQVQTALSARAPIAAPHASDILKVIQEARTAYRQAVKVAAEAADVHDVTERFPIHNSAPASAQASTTATTGGSVTPAPKPKTVDDVWDNFTSTTIPAQTTSKPAASSSLFGSTIKSATTHSTPKSSMSVSKGKNSALFGKTIKSDKARQTTSPSFMDVTRQIYQDLAPVPRPQVIEPVVEAAPSTDAQDVKSAPVGANPLPISSSSRSPIPSSNSFSTDAALSKPDVDSEVADEPSPPKRSKIDTIVQVKKKSSKSSKPKISTEDHASSSINGSSDVPAKAASSSTSAATSSKPKEKNPKKRTAVPDFDYSTAPNLLDNPRSGVKDQGKKKKKEKKERKELKGADFGPAPKEKSNMRAGNKSGTF